ncbi:MAG: hydroxymethylglutaryl-CoA lyase [Vampirovibrionales bacterium]|nr:hydroxymethylglutaryl-CoA lyase [Vampirovibrionales bacterium]
MTQTQAEGFRWPNSVPLPQSVQLIEVGPRDGLQNEPAPWTTTQKIALIEQLGETGLNNIEIGAFVHPGKVPQMADSADVIQHVMAWAKQGSPPERITYSALVPNTKGLARALESGIKRIAVFTAASDAFNTANIGMTVEASLQQYQAVIQEALAAGVSVRGYVSTAFVCPYAGLIAKTQVRPVIEALLAMGVDEVSVGDTIGAAVPTQVTDTLAYVLERIPAHQLALHCHDTYGYALANTLAALQLGITRHDSSIGGLGGCPYAPGASGNLATEKLVGFLNRMGIQTGVDTEKLNAVAQWVKQHDNPCAK